MSQKLQAVVQQRGETSYVRLSGAIDESSELGLLADRVQGHTALIDLGEIDRINTYGVREWVRWLGRLEEAGVDVVLVECSPAVVAQLNAVSNFTAGGVVESFYVPYYCPACNEEKALLCDTAEMGPPPHEPPICRCDGCDQVMDFDDMPGAYFAFLARHAEGARARATRAPSPPPERETGGGDASLAGSRAGGEESAVAWSLPSVPSLPGLAGRAESTAEGGPRRWGGGAEGRGAPEEEESAPAPPPARPEAPREPLPPGPGAAVAARIFIGVLVLGLAALAYALFAEP